MLLKSLEYVESSPSPKREDVRFLLLLSYHCPLFILIRYVVCNKIYIQKLLYEYYNIIINHHITFIIFFNILYYYFFIIYHI